MPRIAVGTVDGDAGCEPLLWGLLGIIQKHFRHVQAFRARACFARLEGARVVTGRAPRHLDSWMMGQEHCSDAFRRGTRGARMVLLAGQFDSAAHASTGSKDASGGSLDTLCDWLDMPRIALVDVSRCGSCCLPQRPAKVDAILLDRVPTHNDVNRWRTEFEALWGVPVIGHLDEAAPLRALVDVLPGSEPALELCAAFAARLHRHLQLDRLLQLAERAPLAEVESPRALPYRRPLRIAVAYDDSFSCYFPGTLDRLEAAGAVIRDFSPLRSESLPDATDLVYFGCGHPERHLDALAANHCLKQSLRSYAKAGGRIYGEGAGMAYLCRQIVLPDGSAASMSGLLPATARMLEHTGEFEPAEVTFGTSCWLGESRSKLRGYRHAGWQIEPTGGIQSFARALQQRLDVVGRGNVIGSRLLVDFAAQTHLLQRFFSPYLCAAVTARQ